MATDTMTPAVLYGWCARHPEIPVRIGKPIESRSESGKTALCSVGDSRCPTCNGADWQMLDMNWFKPKRKGWVPMFGSPNDEVQDGR